MTLQKCTKPLELVSQVGDLSLTLERTQRGSRQGAELAGKEVEEWFEDSNV